MTGQPALDIRHNRKSTRLWVRALQLAKTRTGFSGVLCGASLARRAPRTEARSVTSQTLFETHMTALQSEPQKGLALYLELRFRQTRLYHTFDTTHASVQECRPQRDYRSYLWSPESSHRRLPLEGNYTPSARNK
jgi:hypothetical protein